MPQGLRKMCRLMYSFQRRTKKVWKLTRKGVILESWCLVDIRRVSKKKKENRFSDRLGARAYTQIPGWISHKSILPSFLTSSCVPYYLHGSQINGTKK